MIFDEESLHLSTQPDPSRHDRSELLRKTPHKVTR